MLSAVVGDGFIAKGITFENSAGPSKHQAVALRSGSDFSAFYKCSFVAYQDTLYVHSLRQFYRDCDVYGTVDFIFGNAATVLQNCNLYARKPNENQRNLFTAQGREDPNQNTGISILNCKVAAAADLIPVKSQFKNYLGRPWKKYSRTVYRCIMESTTIGVPVQTQVQELRGLVIGLSRTPLRQTSSQFAISFKGMNG